MTVRNDTIQPNLMKIGGLELQHLVDSVVVDLIRSLLHLLGRIIRPAKTSVDELLTILVQQVKGIQMSTGRDFDQLRETITDLRFGQRAQEGKVQKRVDRSMIRSQTILVIAVVDCDFDGDRSIDQPNHSRGNSNDCAN